MLGCLQELLFMVRSFPLQNRRLPGETSRTQGLRDQRVGGDYAEKVMTLIAIEMPILHLGISWRWKEDQVSVTEARECTLVLCMMSLQQAMPSKIEICCSQREEFFLLNLSNLEMSLPWEVAEIQSLPGFLLSAVLETVFRGGAQLGHPDHEVSQWDQD